MDEAKYRKNKIKYRRSNVSPWQVKEKTSKKIKKIREKEIRLRNKESPGYSVRGTHRPVCIPSPNFKNPIIDTGAPASTGGNEQATILCQVLGISLHLTLPRAIYAHGWGSKCPQAQQIRYTSYLTVFDTNGLLTTVAFDLIKGSSSIIIGLDVKKFGNTINICIEKVLELRGQKTHTKEGSLHTLARISMATSDCGMRKRHMRDQLSSH